MNIFIKKNNSATTRLHTKNNVAYMTFPALDELGIVKNGFSTRIGGVSEGYLSSMNLGLNLGDDKEKVLENYRRISNALDINMNDIVKGKQTHTTNVRVVGSADKAKCFTDDDFLQDVDGLITNESGVALSASFADCVPLFMVDPIKKVIGLSHSGWRGTVNFMGRVTIEKMEEEFGCDPQDIVACIGPSICQDCYEVSEDVAVQFMYAFPKEYHHEILEPKSDGKYMLNLWRANEIVFMKAGVREDNINTTDICTCCNSQTLFSHRATGGKRGIMCGFLELI